jgi:hypothetical protein
MEDAHVFRIFLQHVTQLSCVQNSRGEHHSVQHLIKADSTLSYPHGDKKLDINLLTILFILHNELSMRLILYQGL